MMDAIDEFNGVMGDETEEGEEMEDESQEEEVKPEEENTLSEEKPVENTGSIGVKKEPEEKTIEEMIEEETEEKKENSEKKESETPIHDLDKTNENSESSRDVSDEALSINGQIFVLSLHATSAPNGLRLTVQTRIGHPETFLPAQDGDAAFSVLFKGEAYEVKAPASGTLKQLRQNAFLTLVRQGCRVLLSCLVLLVEGKKRLLTTNLTSLSAGARIEAVCDYAFHPSNAAIRVELQNQQKDYDKFTSPRFCVARELELLVPAAVRYDWLGVLQASCYPFLVSLTLH
ncbi:hypothetical protein WA577_000251, partial [Blastocystis sp. JDR]